MRKLLAAAAVLALGVMPAMAQTYRTTAMTTDNVHHVILGPCEELSDSPSLRQFKTAIGNTLAAKGIKVDWENLSHGSVGHAGPLTIGAFTSFEACYEIQKELIKGGYTLSH